MARNARNALNLRLGGWPKRLRRLQNDHATWKAVSNYNARMVPTSSNFLLLPKSSPLTPAPHPSHRWTTTCRWRSNTRVCMTQNGAGGAPQAVTPVFVGAMVPAQILQEDEIVLVLTKPSLFYIFYSSFPFVPAVLLLGLVLGRIATADGFLTPRLTAWTTAFLCVSRLIWALLVWTSHIYMLTNRRLVTIKGVVNVHMFQAPLRKLQKTEVYRPLGQRIFGAGTIGFSTAAGGAESTWVMVNRPLEINEQIVAAINKAK